MLLYCFLGCLTFACWTIALGYFTLMRFSLGCLLVFFGVGGGGAPISCYSFCGALMTKLDIPPVLGC